MTDRTGAVGHLVPLVVSTDGGVRRHACLALAAVAGHSADLAEAVVSADAFPRALTGLKFPADERVRRAAATLVREVRLLEAQLAGLIAYYVRTCAHGFVSADCKNANFRCCNFDAMA